LNRQQGLAEKIWGYSMALQANDDIKIILGNEYDENLRARLGTVLKDLGAKSIDNQYGVGGSQEISRQLFELDGAILVVESETYIGLSIIGNQKNIDKIRKELGPK
jgi:hypothetical protein